MIQWCRATRHSPIVPGYFGKNLMFRVLVFYVILVLLSGSLARVGDARQNSKTSEVKVDFNVVYGDSREPMHRADLNLNLFWQVANQWTDQIH